MRRLALPVIALLTVSLACSGAGDSGGRTFSGPKPVGSTTPKSSSKTTTTVDPEKAAEAAKLKAAEALLQTTSAEYERAVVVQLTTGSDADFVVAESEAECVAPTWVEAMGVARLKENEITAELLSNPEFEPGNFSFGLETGETMVRSFADCGVDLALVAVRSLGAPNAEFEACLLDALDTEAFLALLVRDTAGEDADPEIEAMLAPLASACG